MEISTVLFDLDGTITDSGSGIINSVKYALKKAGRKIPPEDELRKFIGPPLQEQFMKCCGIEEKEAGWTNDSCIAYPALTCLAATWNPEMSHLYGKSIGEEARYRKKDILLGPGVNIYRTPLNGRNFEYMGEDPYLSATMVVPYIKGVQENGVAACVKHYALNNQEFNRHTTNVQLSDRALYEIYLPAFKAAVQEGGTWSVMDLHYLIFRI